MKTIIAEYEEKMMSEKKVKQTAMKVAVTDKCSKALLQWINWSNKFKEQNAKDNKPKTFDKAIQYKLPNTNPY